MNGQWTLTNFGTAFGKFPLVTFRLVACTRRVYNYTRVVWLVQFRENNDEESWFTEIDGVQSTSYVVAKQYAEQFYNKHYVEGVQVA